MPDTNANRIQGHSQAQNCLQILDTLMVQQRTQETVIIQLFTAFTKILYSGLPLSRICTDVNDVDLMAVT